MCESVRRQTRVWHNNNMLVVAAAVAVAAMTAVAQGTLADVCWTFRLSHFVDRSIRDHCPAIIISRSHVSYLECPVILL